MPDPAPVANQRSAERLTAYTCPRWHRDPDGWCVDERPHLAAQSPAASEALQVLAEYFDSKARSAARQSAQMGDPAYVGKFHAYTDAAARLRAALRSPHGERDGANGSQAQEAYR